MFTHPFIQIVIIKLYLPTLIKKSIIRLHILQTFGIKKEMLILANEQLTIPTGEKLFLTPILTRKFLFSTRQS